MVEGPPLEGMQQRGQIEGRVLFEVFFDREEGVGDVDLRFEVTRKLPIAQFLGVG